MKKGTAKAMILDKGARFSALVPILFPPSSPIHPPLFSHPPTPIIPTSLPNPSSPTLLPPPSRFLLACPPSSFPQPIPPHLSPSVLSPNNPAPQIPRVTPPPPTVARPSSRLLHRIKVALRRCTARNGGNGMGMGWMGVGCPFLMMAVGRERPWGGGT